MAIQVINQIQTRSIDKSAPFTLTEYQGLSTDAKPINCSEGSSFHELDTDDNYKFDGTNWFIDEIGNAVNQSAFDTAGRTSMNSVFGEKIIGMRKPTIASQFQYGYNTYEFINGMTNGGTIATNNSMLVISSGVNINGTASVQTKRALQYIPGHQSYAIGTPVFTTPKENSYQRFGMFDGNNGNGFYVGYEGVIFGVGRIRNGVKTFTPQSQFNMDKIDGTGKSKFNYNPQFGSIVSLNYGFLGFAVVNFEIMTEKGEWVLFHRINYPNTSMETHIANGTLPIRVEVGNTGNNTDINIKVGSISSGIVDGSGSNPAKRTFSAQAPTTTVSTLSGNFITFRNKSTYNSITNYVPALLDLISVAVDGNKNINVQLRKNPTITNSPTWNNIDTNSTLEYSTNSIVTAGTGQLLLSINLQKVGDFFQFVHELDYLLYAGETASFTWSTTSGVTSIVDIGIRWSELF